MIEWICNIIFIWMLFEFFRPGPEYKILERDEETGIEIRINRSGKMWSHVFDKKKEQEHYRKLFNSYFCSKEKK